MSDIYRSWKTTHGDTVEVYEAGNGEYRWRIQAGNGEVVEQGESHPVPWNAIAAAERHHPPVASDG